ncbi:MAG: glycosyltransferase [Proteobacteria bacterium]|nr:MAG: glycosyltransferase [Pseudomonadota bacterium]
MKIVLACFGSGGEVQPYIALGIALKSRGHQVSIATCEHYRQSVVQLGLDFQALRPDLPDHEIDAEMVVGILDPKKGPERLFRDLLLPNLRAQFGDLMRATEGADFLVGHPLVLASRLVADSRKIPWASCALQPMAFFSKFDPPILGAGKFAHGLKRVGPRLWSVVRYVIEKSVAKWDEPYHALREELGLEACPGSMIFGGKFSPQGNLALFPKFLAPPQKDWPAGTFVAGFPRYDHQAHPASAAVEKFMGEGPPPIIFTRGTALDFGARDFFETSVAAAELLGRRALLVVGRDARNFPVHNPRVLAVASAPFGRVFPRAAAIVHQAGIGTAAQGLRAGKPCLLVPGAFDQFDNAARLMKLGSSRLLPLHKFKLAKVAAEIQALLENPAYQTKARAIAGFLAHEDGAVEAARTVEKWASRARGASWPGPARATA